MTKLLTTVIFSITLVACGQNTQSGDREGIDKVCDRFMQSFADGKIPEAIQLLKQNSVMTPASIDTLQVTIDNQINTLLASYGKMLSAEFIMERKIKDFIVKRFYLLRFEKYYLKFDFTLYNGSKGWTITNFTYNEDLIEVLN